MNSEAVKEIVLKVNGDYAERELKKIQQDIVKARKEKEAFLKNAPDASSWTKEQEKQWRELNATIGKGERQLKKWGNSADQIKRVLDNLSGSSMKELKGNLKSLERLMDSGAIKRNTKDWENLVEAIKSTKSEIQKIEKEGKIEEKSNSIVKLGALTTIIRGIGDAAAGAYSRAMQFVDAFARMDEAEVQVIKYTGLARSEVESLNESFKKMETRTPREQLNALAADAGRLGIQSKKDVLDFVAAADQLNVALGEDLGADGVKNIGKLAQLFGDDKKMGLKQAMLSTGSVINELAQSSSAAEGYLMDFAGRVAGVSNQAHMSQAQIMGFASVLDQSMVGVERGATAFQNVLTALYKKPAEMARAAGLDVKEFARTLQTDGNAAFLQFLEGLNRTGGIEKLAPILLSATQIQAAKAFQEGTSVTNEFNQQNSSAQAKLEMSRKRVEDLRIELGQALWPAMTKTNSVIAAGIQVLSSLIRFFSQNSIALIMLTTAVVGYTLAVKAQTLAEHARNAAMTIGKTIGAGFNVVLNLLRLGYGLMTGNIVMATTAQTALNASMAANPIGAVISALVALVTIIGTAVAAMGLFSSSSDKSTRALTAQQQAQQDLQDITSNANKSIGEQVSKVNTLTAVIHDNSRSLKDRRIAVKELQKIIPSYTAQISNEGRVMHENTNAVKNYIKELRNLAILQGAKDKMAALGGELLDLTDSSSRRENALRIRRNRISALKREIPELSAAIDKIVAGGTVTSQDVKAFVAARNKGKYKDIGWDTWLKQKNVRQLAADIKEAEGWVEEAHNKVAKQNQRIDAIQSSLKRQGLNPEDINKDSAPPTPKETSHASTTPTTNSKKGKKGNKHKTTTKKVLTPDNSEIILESRQAKAELQKDFAEGRKDIQEYREEMLSIEIDATEKQMALFVTAEQKKMDKYKALGEKLIKLKQQQAEEQQAWSLRDLERQQSEEEELLESRYARGLVSEEAYNLQRNAITLKYLKKRAELLRQVGNTEEFEKTQQQYQKESARQKLEQVKRLHDALKKYREEFSQKSPEEQYQNEIQLLTAAKAQALKEANGQLQEQLQVEKEFAKIFEALRRKYYDKGGIRDRSTQEILQRAGHQASHAGSGGDMADGVTNLFSQIAAYQNTQQQLRAQLDAGLITRQQYADAEAEIEKQKYERIASYATAAYQSIGAMLQSVSQLMQANYENEAASVEERYNREIQAAGQSSARGKMLEEQKQRDLARLKNKYNRRAMAIEISQAVASTAVAAINAYASASKVSWILGPIAAAMAVAAGAVQIAAITQQHRKQTAGYFAGGFTGGRNYRREAGVVHEGEFVANHEAVNNPHLLPMFQLLDYAQRHNTVASLTADDARRVMPSTAGSQASVTVIDTAQPRTAEAIEQLNRRLEAPIQTYVTIDGPDGLARQWKHYKRLNRE